MPKAFNPPKTPRKTPYPTTSKSKPKPSSNRKPTDRTPGTEAKEFPSINELKRRIRDSKRLLNKPDLPADKRIIQERALKGYEKELADEEKRRDRSRMIKKYHFVRFLDRKTATKEVTRLTKKLNELSSSSTDDPSLSDEAKRKKLVKLESRLHNAKVNLNYTIYYPLTEKYVSLYAEKKQAGKDGKDAAAESDDEDEIENAQKGGRRSSTASTAPVTVLGSQAMWQAVQRCMEEGTLNQLREGKLDLSNGASKAKGKSKGQGKEAETNSAAKEKKDKGAANGKEGKTNKDNITRKGKPAKYPVPAPPPAQEDGDDSDGGFFDV
ncbi:Efg1 domain-containing protein [Aspergillus stella-maris]|uniref:Efg1 domain-containing protein n=1 Tax=Aspergillus stella-maris TaxID=1810926 RepID=UPI003CCD7562